MILLFVVFWVFLGLIGVYLSAPKNITLGWFFDNGFVCIMGPLWILLILALKYDNKIIWRKK